ncbi:MAG: iron-sulfur cluster carrier protein ApbC [Alphaproteobacteria bacterium]|jgi:ATP-binding protein involved in chromosome partitioning|nr:iron-sulfur cluster carrier protein ApbC [Alphaproteobacteria bacterium]MDP6515295.1 iron-sulfur cluster carrier protein ApbC [Alphaproteobacteria bacterium]
MTQVTEQQILDALKQIRDPGRGQDVVALGMISGIVIKDRNVGFAIEIDPAAAEAMEPVRQACEEAVRMVPGVLSATAVLTAEREPAPAPAQQPGPGAKAALPGIDAVVAVASGKGGVGKSTVAVNLALGMAANGLEVGVLDADIYGPSMPRMLGIAGRAVSTDGKTLDPIESYGVKCMSIGLLVEEETPMIWRGPMVQGALEQMLRDVRWGPLDVMVVDMPPGTGDAQLTMAQRVPLAGAVIVSTPQDIALLDARKGLAMFRRVEVPVLGFVENMSYYLCPNCGTRAEIFSHGGAREAAAALGVDFLGEVPLDMEIRETSDDGRPIVVSRPDSPHAKVFREIATRVADQLAGDAEADRPAPRIVTE